MIYYSAREYFNEITTVEVERVTDNFVWIDGYRQSLRSRRTAYFPTFQEAKEWLVDGEKNNVRDLERRLKDAKERLAKAESLTETK